MFYFCKAEYKKNNGSNQPVQRRNQIRVEGVLPVAWSRIVSVIYSGEQLRHCSDYKATQVDLDIANTVLVPLTLHEYMIV